MGYFKDVEKQSGEGFVYVYSGTSLPELEKMIDSLMVSQRYRHSGNGIYERGSKTKRFWLGAFHKYFRFKLSTDASSPDGIKVMFVKDSSGISGGLIGMNQIKTETERLRMLFQQL